MATCGIGADGSDFSRPTIGIAPEQIAVQLRSEMHILRYRWEEVRDLDAKTLRLLAHVAVVRIHPFVDGNGRVTRLLADLVLAAAATGDAVRFDWNIDGSRIWMRAASRFADESSHT